SAEHADLAHSLNALQCRLDAIFREILECANVEVWIGCAENDPCDVIAIHPVRSFNHGLVNIVRVARNFAQLVADGAQDIVFARSGDELQTNDALALLTLAGDLSE